VTAFVDARALLSGILLLTACDRLPFTINSEERATRACEGRLKESLKSPRSYRRLWSTFAPAGPLSKSDLINNFEVDRVQAVRQGNDAGALSNALLIRCLENPACKMPGLDDMQRPKTGFILIEYDAVNAFNVALTGYFSCRIWTNEDGRPLAGPILSATTTPNDLGKQLEAGARSTN
jgi:hypothetical protein